MFTLSFDVPPPRELVLIESLHEYLESLFPEDVESLVRIGGADAVPSVTPLFTHAWCTDKIFLALDEGAGESGAVWRVLYQSLPLCELLPTEGVLLEKYLEAINWPHVFQRSARLWLAAHADPAEIQPPGTTVETSIVTTGTDESDRPALLPRTAWLEANRWILAPSDLQLRASIRYGDVAAMRRAIRRAWKDFSAPLRKPASHYLPALESAARERLDRGEPELAFIVGHAFLDLDKDDKGDPLLAAAYRQTGWHRHAELYASRGGA